jgi:hypothetical protein
MCSGQKNCTFFHATCGYRSLWWILQHDSCTHICEFGMVVYNYKEMFNSDYVHLWHKRIQQCKHVTDSTIFFFSVVVLRHNKHKKLHIECESENNRLIMTHKQSVNMDPAAVEPINTIYCHWITLYVFWILYIVFHPTGSPRRVDCSKEDCCSLSLLKIAEWKKKILV